MACGQLLGSAQHQVRQGPGGWSCAWPQPWEAQSSQSGPWPPIWRPQARNARGLCARRGTCGERGTPTATALLIFDFAITRSHRQSVEAVVRIWDFDFSGLSTAPCQLHDYELNPKHREPQNCTIYSATKQGGVVGRVLNLRPLLVAKAQYLPWGTLRKSLSASWF